MVLATGLMALDVMAQDRRLSPFRSQRGGHRPSPVGSAYHDIGWTGIISHLPRRSCGFEVKSSPVIDITLPLGDSSVSEERAPRTWPSPAATASDPPAVREGEVFVLQPLEYRTHPEVVVLIASSNGASPANRPPLPHVVVLL